jgi:hypothetical protein
MPKTKATPEIEPKSFLYRAREFYATAERAFDPEKPFSWPLYFLYFNTIELAFKAFLRWHKLPMRELGGKKGHQLIRLYERCRGLGLVIGPADRFQIGNVVNLLERANECQGLLYFNPDLVSLPSLEWTRQIAQELIQTVESRLEVEPNPAPGPAVKMMIVWDRPRPKT